MFRNANDAPKTKTPLNVLIGENGGLVQMVIKTKKSKHLVLIDESDLYLIQDLKLRILKQKDNRFRVAFGQGKNIQYLHRFLLNAKKGQIVDHKNLNPLDNRRENIRIVTPSQNNMNSSKRRGNCSSIYKGVHKSKNRTHRNFPWKVELKKENKRYRYSGFKTEIEAALFYNKKALELFGEYARLNVFSK